jgi:hypothetical protein
VGIISIVLAPVTLFVGLRQEVTGDTVAFAQDFLRRVGKETLLAQLFVTFSGTAIVVLGAMMFCVPAWPALALVHFSQYHLLGQLYRLYRERGGEPIRKAEPNAGGIGSLPA